MATKQYWQTHMINQEQAYGCRSTFDIKSLGGGEQKSVWIACYFDNGAWIQTGYVQSGGVSWVQMQFTPAVKWEMLRATPVLSSGTRGTFGFRIEGGVGYVHFNGVDISKITYPETITNTITQHVTMECSYASKPATFPTINFYPAIELYNGSAWTNPTPGSTFFRGTVGGYGYQGPEQNSKLRFNEVIGGSRIK
jgi:hypothetical protein